MDLTDLEKLARETFELVESLPTKHGQAHAILAALQRAEREGYNMGLRAAAEKLADTERLEFTFTHLDTIWHNREEIDAFLNPQTTTMEGTK